MRDSRQVGVSVPPSRDGRGRAEVMNGRSAPRAVICAHRTRGSVGRCHGLTERLQVGCRRSSWNLMTRPWKASRGREIDSGRLRDEDGCGGSGEKCSKKVNGIRRLVGVVSLAAVVLTKTSMNVARLTGSEAPRGCRRRC